MYMERTMRGNLRYLKNIFYRSWQIQCLSFIHWTCAYSSVFQYCPLKMLKWDNVTEKNTSFNSRQLLQDIPVKFQSSKKGETIREAKLRKLMAWDEANFIGEDNRKKEVMQKQPLTTSHKQTYALSVSEQQPPWKPTILPHLLLLLLGKMLYRRKKPFINLGQLCWLCVLPPSCPFVVDGDRA